MSNLKQRQAYPLDLKIEMSKNRIREWYKHWNGKVYVAFSGGKDSTVLLHLVRSLYPDVPAVFCDTGLEYPEIRAFVKSTENVEWVKPSITFKQVITKYGFPVVSKKISMGISRYRKTKHEIQRKLRLYGGINPTSGKKQQATISKKWHYLIDAPFEISESCCSVMKKQPMVRYEKKTERKPFIGTMASESSDRGIQYAKNGCNVFDAKKPNSKPISFWTDQDIWEYIARFNIPYSSIYDMGEKRTGCMFCMFGVHLEKGENRFQRMKRTHPKQWDYCINKLGCGEVLDYIGVNYGKEE